MSFDIRTKENNWCCFLFSSKSEQSISRSHLQNPRDLRITGSAEVKNLFFKVPICVLAVPNLE